MAKDTVIHPYRRHLEEVYPQVPAWVDRDSVAYRGRIGSRT